MVTDGDALTLSILNHCLGGPCHLKPLLGIYPRATLYRRIKELVHKGLLEKRNGLYVTTLAGEMVVREPTADAGGADIELEKKVLEAFPQLRYLPTPMHRDAALLVLGAVTEREFNKQEESLPGFCFIGPPLLWKTKIAEALLAMLGAPPENLVYSPSERGKSLFIRRNARGEAQTIRRLLNSPLVAFDEFHRAQPEVKALIGAYLHGKREIPFENTTIKLRPTPIILQNPKKKTGDIIDRIGVDEAQLRRLVVFLFDLVTIPEEIEDQGAEHLREIRRHPPIKLKAPRKLSEGARHRIKTAIKAIVPRKEFLRLVDYNMVAAMIEGLTGYLGEDVALRAGLLAYGRSLSSIGFAVPGWDRVILKHESPPEKAQTNNPRGEAKQISLPPSGGMDYANNLRLLHNELRARGLSHVDLHHFIVLLKLLRALDLSPRLLFRWAEETLQDAACLDFIRTATIWFQAGKVFDVFQLPVDGERTVYISDHDQEGGMSYQTWDCLQSSGREGDPRKDAP